MSEFSANFSLFPTQEKKSEKSPDFSGNIEIPVSQLAALRDHLNSTPQDNWKEDGEQLIKLRIAGWKAESKAGKQYINGKVSVPMEQGATPTQQQSSGSSLF